MVVSFAGRQNVKMVPFDVVTSCFKVISNSRRVIMFRRGLEMFRFPIVECSLDYIFNQAAMAEDQEFT